MTQTKFIMLGCGTPNCTPGRSQQSSAVIVDDRAYLIDCGAGTLYRAAEAYGRGVPGFDLKDLTHIFLTHLHPDHSTGLAAMIIAPWVRDRTVPLHVYGPAGTQAMVDHLLAAYQIGIYEHANGPSPLNDEGLVVVHEYDAGIVYEDDRVSVAAFRVKHSFLDAFGLKFVTPDKTIVHSGDTCFVPEMIEQARGCDILIHEVYSHEALQQRDPGWKHYHSTVHTSSLDVARIALEAKPGLVVLNHYMSWGIVPDEAILEEIKTIYAGPVVLGKDLEIYE